MPAPRSPSYPNISLSDAIAKARQIYQKEHMSTMTPPVVAEAMGYNGTNGASLKTIASLKKYGLLEGRADDVRLTKDAQTLAIDDPGSADYRAALTRAANAPEVFGEITKQFPGMASERNIAVFLEKQGFVPDAASTVARHYKDSLALVSGTGAPYAGAEEVEPTMPQPQTVDSAPQRTVPIPTATPAVAGLPRVIQDGKLLTISAVVGLKGLRKLQLILANYEKLLEMFEDEGDDEINIDPELQQ